MATRCDNLEDHRLNAIEAGIEAASEAVSALPAGQKGWNTKELLIATEAARAAVAYLAAHVVAPK